MTSNQNYKPIEILRAFEEGNDLPALEAGLADQEKAEAAAYFIHEVNLICEKFANGADPRWCMEQVRDRAFGLKDWWSAGCVAREALETINYGQVYALVNESMPGLFKVGFTTGIARDRAAQLSSATGIPTPFKLLFAYDTINCRNVEAGIHDLLKEKRVNDNREFFRCQLKELVTAFESAITAEYAAHGFSMSGPVVSESEFSPDSELARYWCQRLSVDASAFFHPEPVDPADNPFN